MRHFNVEIVLWEDHMRVEREAIPKDPDIFVSPTLSVGIIIKETKKIIVLVSNIERYPDRDDCNYLLIYKGSIISRSKYGKIKLRKLQQQ